MNEIVRLIEERTTNTRIRSSQCIQCKRNCCHDGKLLPLFDRVNNYNLCCVEVDNGRDLQTRLSIDICGSTGECDRLLKHTFAVMVIHCTSNSGRIVSSV